MRQFFAHHHFAIERIDFPALIANHHPRRNAHRARRQCHGIGVVFTKTNPPAKQKFIHIAHARRRLQRIIKFFRIEKLHKALGKTLHRFTTRAKQPLGKRSCTRGIKALRQTQGIITVALIQTHEAVLR